MTALHIGKSIYRSPLRRGLLLIILPALRRPLFHTSEQLAIRPIFLLLSTAAALLGAPLATQGTPVNFVITGSLVTARYFHTATLLPNGKVLIAGGDGNGPSQESAELYDPASGTWTATGSLSPGTSEHTATLLPNGKVLVAGGVNGDIFEFGSILANAELYDPTSGTWTATGSLGAARGEHTATLLPNGKVLVAGGVSNSYSFLVNAELYDPASGTWTATGSLGAARSDHTATLLPNGKVLVAGGFNGNLDTGFNLASAELYDPASGTWTATGSLGAARSDHTATLLPNGKVLVAGGFNDSNRLASAELYDPASGTWTATGSLGAARNGHIATLLPNGKVLVAGGFNGDSDSSILVSAELYDPASGTWSATGSLVFARGAHTATLLPNGRVLIAAGVGPGGVQEFVLATAELYYTTQLDTTQPLLNISTRARVSTQDQVLIGGFIITGAQDKTVLIRGIGPSLTTFGIAMPLADPTLELHDHTSALIVSNDNWRDSQQSQISATGLAPSSDSESVILATLAPGAYTAVLRGKAMTTGTGLVEVYDVDQNPNTQITNLSARGFVGTGDDVMIGGTIFRGSPGTAYRVLVRAIGPSLANMGVATPLLDPALSLHDANGNVITTDDNWKDSQESEIAATGLAPTDDRESAIIVTLPAGAYTAIVRGVNGTTGVGLVEVFNLH